MLSKNPFIIYRSGFLRGNINKCMCSAYLPYPEAYQKQADIIPAKILHQLCLPQVTGAESAENQRKRGGERGGQGEGRSRSCQEGPGLSSTTGALKRLSDSDWPLGS